MTSFIAWPTFFGPTKIEKFATRLDTQLKTQVSSIWNENEQAELDLALEKERIEQTNFWSNLIDKINHPETIDYSFLKKYGVLFLIFFLALWYISKRKK